MKVGILTWWDVLNYGSAFQAYALQEALKDLGTDPQILQHDRKMPDYYGNKLDSKGLAGLLKWLRNQTPNRIRFRQGMKKKFENFETFHNEYLNVGGYYDKTDVDRVVIGSDQIFDVDYFYYPFQFGRGIGCNDINTYAPSFGETKWETLAKQPFFNDVCEDVRKMREINARDSNTQQILQKITGREVPKALDPVLMYGFEKEKELWNKRLIDEKYCVVYTWGGYTTSDEFAKQCNDFAARNGLKLVSVGEYRKWCQLNWDSASPVEFFELFRYADMVITNMFHGTCFSIILERPFYSFIMPHNEHKVGGILNELGLETQMRCCIEGLMDSNIPSIDYVKTNQLLLEKRIGSKSILSRIINQ